MGSQFLLDRLEVVVEPSQLALVKHRDIDAFAVIGAIGDGLEAKERSVLALIGRDDEKLWQMFEE